MILWDGRVGSCQRAGGRQGSPEGMDEERLGSGVLPWETRVTAAEVAGS